MHLSERMRVLLASLLLFSLPAVGQGDLKIGFVNYSKILENAPQAVQASTRLEQEFEPRSAELREVQNQVRELEDHLAESSADMEDVDLRRLERELLGRKRELKRAQANFQEDLNIRRNEELGKLEKLVEQVIATMADEEEFDLILTERAIISASERVDITDRVLERLKALQ
jgi:outer membrane protein